MTNVCPRCKGSLTETKVSLRCRRCGAHYWVIEGVPVLVPESLSEHHLHQLEYFDAEFSRYAEYTLENWRLSYVERILGELAIFDGEGPYLDVGVGGSGATVIEAARRGVAAVGCDLSIEGVLAARRFAREEGVGDRAMFVVCAAEALPFPDSSFAAASAIAVLEHLDDDAPAVEELARVLQPGGVVWLTVPHSFRYMPLPIWPFYWWHDKRIGHKRHYDEKQLTGLCARVGLEHIQTRFSAHPVKILQFLGSMLLPRMREPGSALWWRLERLDRRAESRARGAMHLNGIFRRAAPRRGYRGRSDAGA